MGAYSSGLIDNLKFQHGAYSRRANSRGLIQGGPIRGFTVILQKKVLRKTEENFGTERKNFPKKKCVVIVN